MAIVVNLGVPINLKLQLHAPCQTVLQVRPAPTVQAALRQDIVLEAQVAQVMIAHLSVELIEHRDAAGHLQKLLLLAVVEL